MLTSASATSYRYCIGIDCLQLFQLRRAPGLVETYQDREVLICQEQFLKPVEIFLTVITQFVFVLFKIFKIETFKSGFRSIQIFIETYQDLSRFIKIS
jgi:hypothetical protein